MFALSALTGGGCSVFVSLLILALAAALISGGKIGADMEGTAAILSSLIGGVGGSYLITIFCVALPSLSK